MAPSVDFLRDYLAALVLVQEESAATLDTDSARWVNKTVWNLEHILDLHKLATDGEIPEDGNHRRRDGGNVAIEDNRPKDSFIRHEAAPTGQAAHDVGPVWRDVDVSLNDPDGTIPAEAPRDGPRPMTAEEHFGDRRESSQNVPRTDTGPLSPSETPAQPRGPDTRSTPGLEPNVSVTRNDPPRTSPTNPNDVETFENLEG